VRQVRVVGDAVVQRRQDTADRPRVDAAVGVAADAPVDRAGVQARPAADALQALAERRLQDARPAVVEQDEVELLRAVALARPAWASACGSFGSARPVCRDRIAAMLSRVWWTAGATRCDGRSPASWRMNSPKSVSVTSTPAASRAGLRWTSSDVIDLDLTARV